VQFLKILHILINYCSNFITINIIILLYSELHYSHYNIQQTQ
jgi:hypothetical protein